MAGPSMPTAGNWVDSAAIDGERWVDASDAVAMDAWGTAEAPIPQAVFDPQKAAQEKHVPKRRTSLPSALLFGVLLYNLLSVRWSIQPHVSCGAIPRHLLQPDLLCLTLLLTLAGWLVCSAWCGSGEG